MSSKTASSSKRGGSGTGKSASKQSEHHHLSTASTLNFFKIEDAASKELTPDKSLKECAVQIASIRSSLTQNSASVRKHELKDHLLISAMKLRRLNRYFNFRNNFARDRLAEARRKVEENHLLLQNLTNEITHLRKNIEVCMEFQAGDSDIELIGIDEFYAASATGESNGTEVGKTDTHRLHVARLKHELNERRSMLANLQELEGRKSALLSDIRGKEQRLSQIGSKISAIKKATIPLFEVLGLKSRPFEIKDKTKKSVCPFSVQLRPLYTNEEVCRDIFGTHSIELGSDALVRVTEEIAGPSNGTKESYKIDERDDRKEREPLACANAKDFFALEDQLAKAKSVAQCKAKAAEHLAKLRTVLERDDGIEQKQRALSELLPIVISLRRFNRHSNLQIMATRAKMAKMRECVEKQTDELRNVYVGVDFLKKCVDLCLDFPSPSDSDIDLIPVERFFAETNAIALPEAIRNDAHQLRMARLKHELWTRKNLMEKLKEMEQRKKSVLEAIDAAEKALGRVNPRVDTLKKTAKPLLDIVGLKAVALSVHNREIPFRPFPVGAEAFREIFGDAEGAVAESSELKEAEEEEEEFMELGEDYQLISG